MCTMISLVKIHENNRFNDLVCISTGVWLILTWFGGLVMLVESISQSFSIKKQLFSIHMDWLQYLGWLWGALSIPFMCRMRNLVKIHGKIRCSDFICLYTVVWLTLKWFGWLAGLVESISCLFLIKKRSSSALMDRSWSLHGSLGILYNSFIYKMRELVKIHEKNRSSDFVCLSMGAWSTLKWFYGYWSWLRAFYTRF